MGQIKGYFDTAATALPDPELYRIFEETAFLFPGNPSSIHRIGLAAGKRLEEARAVAATALGALPEQIIFTSGGTESNNIVISSFLLGRSPGEVLCPQTEHASVFEPSQILEKNGWKLTHPRLDSWGRVSAQSLEEALSEHTRLVCLMAVNNETGLVQDISELIRVIRKYEKKSGRKIHVHCDAVQAPGKSVLDPISWNVDTLSLSSHKIGAPHGSGLLYLNRLIDPLYRGGGQEEGLRPGTHNLAGIVAFSEGLKKQKTNAPENIKKHAELLRTFYQGIKNIPKIIPLPYGRGTEPDSPFVPSIINIAVPSLPSEAALRLLSDKGFSVSAGSACSSKKLKKTRILTALGVPENQAAGALRISFDYRSNVTEISDFLEALSSILI